MGAGLVCREGWVLCNERWRGNGEGGKGFAVAVAGTLEYGIC